MSKNESLTRETVLRAACEMAQDGGIGQVGYNGLARQLGVRPQSMYRYVANITELRIEMLRYFLAHLGDLLAESTVGLDPAQALKAYAVTLYDACHRNPLYYEALQLMHLYDLVDALQDQLLALLAPARRAFEELYPDGAEAARRFQLFMATNLGYAQMSITEFIPVSLHDDRAAFIASLDELLEFYHEKRNCADAIAEAS